MTSCYGANATLLVRQKTSKPDTAGDYPILLSTSTVMLAFWGVALWGWLASGYLQPLFMFGYIGTSIGLGLGLYAR